MASDPPVKQRLFAHPSRPNSYRHGGRTQVNHTTTKPAVKPSGGFPAWVNKILDNLHLTGGDRTAEGRALIAGQTGSGVHTGAASAGATAANTVAPTGSGNTPADWLKQAGWPTALIPTMVAIGGAESSWKVNAVSPTNTDGSVDRGWLQINSIHGYDASKLTTDPVYTAQAALAIYKSQGLSAWTTYTSGAYRQYLGATPRSRSFSTGNSATRTRPGGQATGESDGPDVTSVLADWADARDGTPAEDNQFVAFGNTDVLFGIPNPFNLSKGLSGAVHDTKDFLKILAWIINPINILRMVELLIGLVLMAFGFQAMLQAYGESHGGGENALSRSGLGRVSRAVAAAPRKGAKKAANAGVMVAAPEVGGAEMVGGKAAASKGSGGTGKSKGKAKSKPTPSKSNNRQTREIAA